MLKKIENDEQFENAIARLYSLMQIDIKPDSKEPDELEALSILIKECKSIHYPM